MPGKFKKIAARILAGILIFAVAAAVAGYLLIKLYVIPKYNAALGEDAAQGELLGEKDLLGFAKYFTDRQVIDNIVNFDKDSAKDILTAMQESEEEPTPAQKASKKAWNKRITAKVEAIPTPTPAPTPEPEKEAPKTAEGSTAKLKAYIKSVLTQAEINKALSLYNKYNHLL